MKNRAKYKPFYIVSVLFWIVTAISAYTTYNKGKDAIYTEMSINMQQAEIEDYNWRLNNTRHTTLYSNLDTIYVDSISLESINGYKTYYFDATIPMSEAIRLTTQYTLATGETTRQINPDEFDSLFHEKLSSHIRVQQTGIIYRFKDKVQYSRNDSTSFLKNAFMSEERVLDVQKVVRVQGWAKVGLIGILLASSTPMLITTACLFLLAIALTLYLILKKTKGVPLEEEGWTIYSGMKYQLAQNKLLIEGDEITIRPAELKLLHLFVMHPKHELSKEDIAHEFWPKEDAPENKIYNHISTLKGIFKGFANYDIKRKGNLYQLNAPNYNKRGYQRLWNAIVARLKALRII